VPGGQRMTRCEYQLLAIDLDGTLLDSRGSLSPRNRAALHRAHEAGLNLVICTGRSFTETRPVLAAIGLDLDASVTVGGAILTDLASGRTLERASIDAALAREAAGWLRACGYPVLWLLDADEAGFDGYVIDGPRRHAAIDRWLELSPVRMRCVNHVPGDRTPPVRLTIVDEPEPLRRLSAELEAAFAQRLTHNLIHVRSYDFMVIEAFAGHVSKWFGIERFCGLRGIDPRRTVAVGDDVNDLAMIRAAGQGVAVGNADPAVRAAAARVVADNNSDGVAELIDALLSGALPGPD
jgi:Cof subfamily protein (haloacid dehalogenase superfamily)